MAHMVLLQVVNKTAACPASAWLFASWLMLVHGTCVHADSPGEIDRLVSRWVALEQQRTALQRNWRERQRAAELQLTLLQQETSTLTRFLDSEERDLGDVDARRSQVTAEQSEIESRQDRLEQDLPKWTGRLEAMRDRLPPPMRELWVQARVEVADSEAPLTQRLTALLKLLSDLADFDRRIALHRATMDIDGRRLQVEQVYLGLSHGWYLTADNASAGAGRATAEGWRWQHDALQAADREALRELIEASRSSAVAELISLPIKLR